MDGASPVRPEDVLPEGMDGRLINGVQVRKGTVAAFCVNARVLDTLAPGTPEYDQVVAQLRALAPALAAVGVLDIFEPRSAELKHILASA